MCGPSALVGAGDGWATTRTADEAVRARVQGPTAGPSPTLSGKDTKPKALARCDPIRCRLWATRLLVAGGVGAGPDGAQG